MKIYTTITAPFIIAALMVVIQGCKYDVAEPLWDKPISATTPVITNVIPVNGALAGVNTITIQGLAFSDSLSDMTVYFDNTSTEIVSTSNSSIVVRRPNIFNPTALVRVISSKAFVAARISPYRVDQVFQKYGSFVDNVILSAVCFDNDTMYVTEANSPYYWFKIRPNGYQTRDSLIGSARRIPTDIRIRNGTMYWLGNNREILQVNLNTKITSRWTQTQTGKPVKFGDFGQNNYFYTGGTNTDLCIIPPNPPIAITATLAGAYQAEDILAVRVFNGYVYVASRTVAGAPAKIYKQLIGTGASLGGRELVLDMSATAFNSRLIRALSFSSSGTMYITTDAINPLLVFDGNTLDYFYKEIITHEVGSTTSYWFGKQAYWGNNNYLYIIGNDPNTNASATDAWNILRIDMGTTGAPYY